MGGKSCFFIGHRETSEAIYPALYAVVEQHILEYGVTELSSVITVDLTALQRQQLRPRSISTQM